MGNVYFAGGKIEMNVPVAGIPVKNLMEGTIVMIPEDGMDVPFYIAKHDYESGLNGNGRTLLVRKDVYSSRVWNDSYNTYASSKIDSWLNSTYKAFFDATMQEAIGSTSFYYTKGNKNGSLLTLERSFFILSVTELGANHTYAPVEGSTLPIASTLCGITSNQWTRTPVSNENQRVYWMTGNGLAYGSCTETYVNVRPCFTLPSDLFVYGTPNADGSVNLIL